MKRRLPTPLLIGLGIGGLGAFSLALCCGAMLLATMRAATRAPNAADTRAETAPFDYSHAARQYVATSRELIHEGAPAKLRLVFSSRHFNGTSERKISASAGRVAYVTFPRIIQIIDEQSALVDCGEKTMLASGYRTAGMVDGDLLFSEEPVECLGPISYTTVLGAKKTIIAFRRIDADAWQMALRSAWLESPK